MTAFLEGAKAAWLGVFQIVIFIAALVYLLGQQPQVDYGINHINKVLTISPSGLSPLYLRIYAIEFSVNWDRDAAGHASINSAKPVSWVSTPGLLYEMTSWKPWWTMHAELSKTHLPFDEWTDKIPSPYELYCLVIEARNMLSNQFTIEPLLTPKQKFRPFFAKNSFEPVLFDFLAAALGGGDPKPLLDAEAQIKSDCVALYDNHTVVYRGPD